MTGIHKAYHPEELTVLVVEDTALFTREIKHALPQHAVIFAPALEEAKARYDECLPDITFLDIDLPDGSGFELIDYIRAHDPQAYIAILTGSNLKEDIARAEAKGVHHYLIKPFTKTKIDQIIAQYLDLREKAIAFELQKTRQHRRQQCQKDA